MANGNVTTTTAAR